MKPTFSENNTSPEIRAFIYQQLTDLEGLLPQGSNISIAVDDPSYLEKTQKKASKKTKIHKKKVVIQLETQAGNLVVESENFDIYKAIQAAKENLRSQLTTLHAFLSGMDREEQIDNIISKKYLH